MGLKREKVLYIDFMIIYILMLIKKLNKESKFGKLLPFFALAKIVLFS